MIFKNEINKKLTICIRELGLYIILLSLCDELSPVLLLELWSCAPGALLCELLLPWLLVLADSDNSPLPFCNERNYWQK